MSSLDSLEAATRPNYFVSAPWRSSGKTMVTMGLAAVAQCRELAPQTFKKGPDFIDPMWMRAASGRPCYNLDPRQQSEEELVQLYSTHSETAMCSLVEGTMGFHDGLAVDGSDSNAAIAKLLKLPVVLVVDCRGMHRTVAALLMGIVQFDEEVDFAGVILNRLRTPRHGKKIRQAINQYTDVQILGEIPESDHVGIREQHLGLIPSPSHEQSQQIIATTGDLLVDTCDLDAFFGGVADTKGTSTEKLTPKNYSAATKTLKIGVANDAAFNFYYQDDLDTFESAGIDLVNISPLSGSFPDDLDGLIIGGGFPEHYAKELSDNVSFRAALKRSIESGLPIHAECGGLMYLCNNLVTENDGSWPMVGVIDAVVTMCAKSVGRGYMQLSRIGSDDENFWAHEFHHSNIQFDSSPEFLYRVDRGYGIDGSHDGVHVFNVIASYAHFRHTKATPWIDWFLSRVTDYKKA